jgi:O-antigen/teichoic acid export membrane protein
MLLRNTFLFLPAQLLPPLAQFVAAIAWTHWFLPRDYGLLTLMMATQELVYVLTLSWWSHFTMRYVGEFRRDGRLGVFQGVENGVLIVAIAAQSLAALPIAAFLGFSADTELVAAAMAFIVLRAMATHFAERARSTGRIDVYSVLQIGGLAGGMALAHVLIVTVGARPAMGLAGMAAGSALALLIALRMLRIESSRPRLDRAVMRSALSYGGMLMVSGAVAWLSTNGIRIVVEQVEGTVALGLMAVGWGLGQRLVSVVAMLVTAAAYPLALAAWQSGDREGALAHLARNGLLLGGLLLPATVGILMVAPALVEWLVAEPYRATTVAVLPIAAAAAAIRNFRVHFSDQVLLLEERADLALRLDAIEAALTGCFCIAGALAGGIIGACWGVLAGAVSGAGLGFAWAIGRFGLVPPWRGLLRVLAGSLLMAGGIVLLGAPSGPVELVRTVIAGAAIYGGALALMFPADVRRIAARLGAVFSS